MWTVILTAGAKELTLGPFESIDQAADTALARPDIGNWRHWEFSAAPVTKPAWKPPDLSHLGQHNDKYQEGV